MKHAYLIMAHSNYIQLQILLDLLDDIHNDFYVHIDKKSLDFNKNLLHTNNSKLYIYQEISVYWGTYSQVECEYFLIGKAVENKYDYYHLLSGQDLPLQKVDNILDFFEKNNGLEFILFNNKALNGNTEISRRAKFYHFFTKQRYCHRKKFINKLWILLDRFLIALQIVFKINRNKKDNFRIAYGGNWFSITDKLARYILEKQNFVKKRFQYVNNSDELFLQTLVENSEFKSKCYKNDFGFTNLRYISWEHEGVAHPSIMAINDVNIAKNGEYLFARKFDNNKNVDAVQEVLDLLDY